MTTKRDWVPPVWLALLLACTAAIVATVGGFVKGYGAAAIPGAIAIVLFTAAFRQPGRVSAAPGEPNHVESSMLDAVMSAARDLASSQPQVSVVVAPDHPEDEQDSRRSLA
jgi:hypothetical protein